MDIVSQTLQSLIEDERISKIGVRVWLEIARSPLEGNHQDYPIHKMSIAELMRKLKYSRSAIYSAIRQLQLRGYVQSFRVGNETNYILRNGAKVE